MTWTMSASGHTPAPEGADDWAGVEQRLHDELSAVLAKPEYGAGTSFFHGNHVDSNSLHVPPRVRAILPDPPVTAKPVPRPGAAPSAFVVLAARHLDPAEGAMQAGHVVTDSDESAIRTVTGYVAERNREVS
jgi:hypothetical protein